MTKKEEAAFLSMTKRFFLLWLDNWSRNQLFHDFVGSSVDGLDPGVDVGPGNWGLHHVAPTAVKLNTFGGYGVFLKI